MTLLNPAILLGLALGIIPILLHFLMKARPKKLMFPALRLIQQRRTTNKQRMRLKHFWLLLLRIGLIGLVVFAMARPSLPAANYAFNLWEWLTTLCVIALPVGVYFWFRRKWQAQSLSQQDLSHKTMILRSGTIAGGVLGFLLLVGWPWQQRIAAEMTMPTAGTAKSLPVAAIFLFDTSPSMDYKYESRTRLEQARTVAESHLGSVPGGSRVAVASTSTGREIVFQADLVSSRSRIAELKTSPAQYAFNDRLRDSIELQIQDRERAQADNPGDNVDSHLREIYVFTDLSRAGWDFQRADDLLERIAETDWLHVYVIDVGVTSPINATLTGLELSQTTITEGGRLKVEAEVQSVGKAGQEQTVEILVETASGDIVKQGRQIVKLSDESAAQVAFNLQGLTGPIRQGEIRLASADPLASDDRLFFTLGVAPQPDVLILGESREETDYLQKALEAIQHVRDGGSVYRASWNSVSTAAALDLTPFEVICLVNARRPNADLWQKLTEFVSNGGGLALFAGRDELDTTAWTNPAAYEVVPVEMLGPVRFGGGPQQINLRNETHPLFRKFRKLSDGQGLFSTVNVIRAWSTEPAEDAAVIASYSDKRQLPAIVERVVGAGRSIVLTTAVDFRQDGGSRWTDLANSGAFLVFVNELMQYLAHQSRGSFNYVAGEPIIVRLNQDPPFTDYLLRKPGFQQLPGKVPQSAAGTASSILTLRDIDQLGHYEVVSTDRDPQFRAGFSVNPLAKESDLTRLTNDDLDAFFGVKRYSLARQIEELDRVVSDMRIGREVYSFVLFFAILFFVGEHFIANWFYDQPSTPVSTA